MRYLQSLADYRNKVLNKYSRIKYEVPAGYNIANKINGLQHQD